MQRSPPSTRLAPVVAGVGVARKNKNRERWPIYRTKILYDRFDLTTLRDVFFAQGGSCPSERGIYNRKVIA